MKYIVLGLLLLASFISVIAQGGRSNRQLQSEITRLDMAHAQYVDPIVHFSNRFLSDLQKLANLSQLI